MTVWKEPPAALGLGAGEIQLWRCAEDMPAGRLADLGELLDSEERSRAQQYRFEPDRRRFVLCRGILRELLGRYLGCGPSGVRFSRGAHGKPGLAVEQHPGSRLQFNLSHTRGMCLIGFAEEHAIGVDVEAVDPKRDWSMLGRRFLHPGEWEMISALAMGERAAAFYTCWTCKEAYLKARGDGLTRALTSFQVSFASGSGPIQLLDDSAPRPGGNSAQTRWWLERLDPGEGFAAAVASPGRPVQWQCFQYR